MADIPPMAQQAIDRARRGDVAGALNAARLAVAAHPENHGLHLFIAMLHSRQLELEEALVHVRKAVEIAPTDPFPRVELVRLLIGLNRIDEAERELDRKPIPGLEPLRLRATLEARRENHTRAAQIFRQIVAAEPRDHESWGSLGTCLLANGQPQLAIEPLARALQLRPDLRKFREKLMEAQVTTGQGEIALQEAKAFSQRTGDHPAALVTVARLEDLLGRPERAVEILRSVLAAHPDHVPSLVALAELLERENRIDELGNTIDRIEQLDRNASELPLLRARLAYRRGGFAEALELARAVPATLDRGARAQLIGLAEERLGNSAEAFRAFEEMNGVSDFSRRLIAEQSEALRNLIDERASITTGEWVRGWSAAESDARGHEPAFLIGFPRSGTTLLDTFLMGHPGLCVAEEKPMLQAVSEQLGDYRRLGALNKDELEALRKRYFAAASNYVPDLGGRLLVDKFPLGAIEIGIFHRLFPRAKVVFLQRHPCDVVLSCFFTRFQPTPMLVSFSTLEDAAKLYDKVMGFWEQCRASMPLNVHHLRYEELVRDAETQMRALISFLGVDWDDGVLDHRKAAANRAFVLTASYAQVVEPLYDRSIGRWERYRDQLTPVLPILLPWAERMGYQI